MGNSISSTPLSGTQCVLEACGYTASIASIGASLRSLRYHGRNLIVPFDANQVRPFFRGAILAPWPNRVVDGRYTFDGVEQQLYITEPSRGHALHGLVSWLNFTVVGQATDRLVLAATVEAQQGYPHQLMLEVHFSLGARGLRTTVTAVNAGPTAAPFGVAPHPYLVAGEGRVNDWTLELPARRMLTVTPDRLIPLRLRDINAQDLAAFDFRTPRTVDDTFIDHAFTGFDRDEEGGVTVRVTTQAGTGVALSWGAECSWVQVHTADQPVAAIDRIGLAVEPMTCPPDAFNSGTNLNVLEPADSTRASWTIQAID
ncbi:galactose mutarotase [Cryobacterium sp. TMT2-17-1]|uniref:aldose 1-epimerase family protein n=1 Tax=unclassified Cryobacterium TaxID=2649013 RepID=UPI00106D48CE|nr:MULTISPECIES: aldose 1-epimerase family protein [unclassified Cryobacterium]TFC49774.1 galactose mutarotase [Cryobacterium sp. TMT2-17-1]TFC65121.1 galactose mutarotase [Cryobacterium sp. TMT2-4]